VRAAGRATSAGQREAVEQLCRLYWYPLYAYVRRRGVGADQAADLTQGFFARLLEQRIVRGADSGRGKFRSYLLGALKHYLSHEWRRARAQKRGGGREVLRLGLDDGESRFVSEPAHNLTAEKLFDRQWALTVLELALDDLRRHSVESGKERHFLRLKGFLAGGTSAEYRDAGGDLGLSEGAVRVVIHRLRRKYRDLVRGQIGRTVQSPAEVEDELHHLFRAIESCGD
jgi:RNA polymerase sigma-70 factor (ECF subfamily)